MSTSFSSAKTRRIRHCCSVMSCSRRWGRKRCMTASRALIKSIGRERPKDRIGRATAAPVSVSELNRSAFAAVFFVNDAILLTNNHGSNSDEMMYLSRKDTTIEMQTFRMLLRTFLLAQNDALRLLWPNAAREFTNHPVCTFVRFSVTPEALFSTTHVLNHRSMLRPPGPVMISAV